MEKKEVAQDSISLCLDCGLQCWLLRHQILFSSVWGNFSPQRSFSNHRTVIKSCQNKANEDVRRAVPHHKGGLSTADSSEMSCSFCSLLIKASLAHCPGLDPCPQVLWQRSAQGKLRESWPAIFCIIRDASDVLVTGWLLASQLAGSLNNKNNLWLTTPLETQHKGGRCMHNASFISIC